jgi:hypothetical protein
MSWTHHALAASRTARRPPAAESGAVQHVGEIGHDHIRTVLPERVGMPGAVNADHVAESACPPRCHAGQRDRRRLRQPAVRARAPGRPRGRVLGGLAAKMLAPGDNAIDPRLEPILDPGGRQHVAAVGAAGHDSGAGPRPWQRTRSGPSPRMPAPRLPLSGAARSCSCGCLARARHPGDHPGGPRAGECPATPGRTASRPPSACRRRTPRSP